MPADLVRQSLVNIQQDRATQLEKRSKAERQMTRQLGQARGFPKADSGSARVGRGRDALLKTHERLAKKELAVPKALGALGGLVFGQVSVTVVPPFDYDVVIPTKLAGNEATIEGTSDRRTGKMSVSAITATERGFNGGSMYATVGVYFHPPDRGTLTLRAAPKFSFQWWTNSLGSADLVRSFGQLGLTVYGVDVAGQTSGETGPIKATAGNEFFSWDETQAGQIGLDFGFDVQAAELSAQLSVNRSLVYLLFVDADVHVEGLGWPGSLAGSKLSVTVPYLTYDFQAEPVISL